LASFIAVFLALTAGVLAWQQRQGVLALKKQAASLRHKVATKDDALQEQAALLDRLQTENEVYSREVASLREKVSARTPASTAGQDPESSSPPDSSEAAVAKMFSKMAKDPKMKEVARQWQLAEIKKVYGDFVRSRHLDPQQAKQFFDLLLKEDTRSLEETARWLRAEEKGTRADDPDLAAQKAEIERHLKLLLGDNGYAEYQEYKTSANDRKTLFKIQEHFARTSVPLRKDQANTLLQIMLEEHGLNQRVFERMETVLTPEQSDELQRFQDENQELQRVRTDAAAEMMTQKNKTDTPTPSP
jgi:hypothetical protein